MIIINREEIGHRIRSVRRWLDMPQREAARRAGGTVRALREVERGESRDPEVLSKLCKALGVPFEPDSGLPDIDKLELAREVLRLALSLIDERV